MGRRVFTAILPGVSLPPYLSISRLGGNTGHLQYFAEPGTRNSIFCSILLRENVYYMYIHFPYNPVQRFIKIAGSVSQHGFQLPSSKIKSIHSESHRSFGDIISSWAVYPAERVKNKEIQVSGIDFTQHLDILLQFFGQFPLFEFFDILPKELPAGSVWAYFAGLRNVTRDCTSRSLPSGLWSTSRIVVVLTYPRQAAYVQRHGRG